MIQKKPIYLTRNYLWRFYSSLCMSLWIIGTSHERYVFSNHQYRDCLCNISFRVSMTDWTCLCCHFMTKYKWCRNNKSSILLACCEENPPLTVGFISHSGPIMRKAFPRHNIIMVYLSIMLYVTSQVKSLPAWVSNYTRYKVCTVEVWGWKSNFISHSTGFVIIDACCD